MTILEQNCIIFLNIIKKYHKSKEESGLIVGLSYNEVLTGKKNTNEAEVVLLTEVACEAKQQENIQKNIVISGIPECISYEVKQQIQ